MTAAQNVSWSGHRSSYSFENEKRYWRIVYCNKTLLCISVTFFPFFLLVPSANPDTRGEDKRRKTADVLPRQFKTILANVEGYFKLAQHSSNRTLNHFKLRTELFAETEYRRHFSICGVRLYS